MKVMKLFCLILPLFIIAPLFSQTIATFTLPTDVMVSPGETFATPLLISIDSTAIETQVILEYDSTKIKFSNIIPGKDLFGFSIFSETDLSIPVSSGGNNQNVLIRLSAEDTSKISGANLELAQINWHVTGFNGTTNIVYDQRFENTYVTTADSNRIFGEQLQFIPGSLKIIPDTTAILSLSSDHAEMPVGSFFEVELNVSQINDLHTFQLAMQHDPMIVQLDSIKEGNFLNMQGTGQTNWQNPFINNVAGSVQNIKCTRQDTFGVHGSGVLAILYFRTLAPGNAKIQFTQDQCQFDDPGSNPIPIASFSNLTINIIREPGIELFISDTTAAPNRYTQIPLIIKGVADFDIISTLIEIKFDSSCLLGVDVINKGTLTEHWQPPIVNNMGTSFYFALAGSKPLEHDGVLVYLRFLTNPKAKENHACTISFAEAILNEGSPQPKLFDGSFRIRGLQVAGSTIYQGTRVPIPNVNLILSGQTSLTKLSDENGNYNINQLPYGNFRLKPQKSNDQGRFVSPFDAALILQYVVGINQLSPYQRIAADVSGDGTISTFDAALIMRYSVSLDNKFPVMMDSLDSWDFVPASFAINDTNWGSHSDSLVFDPLEDDQLNQDFIGIVYGDVSQNWVDLGMQSNPVYKPRMYAAIQLGNPKFADAGILEIPLHIRHTNAVNAIEIEIAFPAQELELMNIKSSELSKEFLLNYHQQKGVLKIALAGVEPITGMGQLLDLHFKFKGNVPPESTEKLVINHAWFNDEEVYVLTSENSVLATVPQRLELSPNYPNPFNQETVFRISIPEIRDNKISLVIYNINGQVVRTLLNRNYGPGQYTIRWNGTNDAGNMIASGEYLCVLKAGTETQVQRLMLVR